MPSTLSPAVAAAHGAAATSGQATGASRAQQLAALNQMLNKYQIGQSHGESAAVLTTLGKRILAAAKTLGQHVTLPKAPAVAAPASSEVAGDSQAAAKPRGTVNTTA
jgi:hypothetical protein